MFSAKVADEEKFLFFEHGKIDGIAMASLWYAWYRNVRPNPKLVIIGTDGMFFFFRLFFLSS